MRRRAGAGTGRGPQVRGSLFAPIPKVLHQTWKTPQVPAEWRSFRESWLRHHPGWRHVLWTDEDNRRLIAEHHPWFLPVYDAFPRHIQRVDAAKYFILYTHGGVYADLDSECLQPLDPLLARGGAVVGRSRDGVIECAVLASPPRHPLWEIAFREMQAPPLLARLFRGRRRVDATHVLFSTGPQMMRRAVRRYLAEHCRGEAAPGITVLPPRYLSARTWWQRYERIDEPEAFVRHHYSDSWLWPEELALNRWLTARKLTVFLAGLLLAAGGLALAKALS